METHNVTWRLQCLYKTRTVQYKIQFVRSYEAIKISYAPEMATESGLSVAKNKAINQTMKALRREIFYQDPA